MKFRGYTLFVIFSLGLFSFSGSAFAMKKTFGFGIAEATPNIHVASLQSSWSYNTSNTLDAIIAQSGGTIASSFVGPNINTNIGSIVANAIGTASSAPSTVSTGSSGSGSSGGSGGDSGGGGYTPPS